MFESPRAPAFAASTIRHFDDVFARAQSGDADAFSELYLQHKKLVFWCCMRMVRDFSLAEDLTQETFIQLHRKIALFRGDAAFSTWLYRMTVNIVLMHLRKRALPVISFDGLLRDTAEERFESMVGTPDAEQMGVIDRLAIEKALETLSTDCRHIFLLHDVQGFRHSEIASMESCTVGNSKSQLYKARRALRRVLTAQHAFAHCHGPTPRGKHPTKVSLVY
jgi:RNA polymerase sigma-70 factor (ECF subfamily)